MPLIAFDGCSSCSLRNEWPKLHHPKMPMTPPSEESAQRILVVGEGPGESEDKDGHQFVGKTGLYLRKHIPTKWKNKLYWQNAVRCRPPGNRDPEPHEIQCCSTYLEQDIKACDPHAVLAVGRIAVSYFYGPDAPTITHIRGVPFPIEIGNRGAWCYPLLHPSFVARGERKSFETGLTTNATLPVFREDIKEFFDKVTHFTDSPPTIVRPPKRPDGTYDILYPKTEEDAWNLFLKLKEPYAIDYETTQLKPYLRDAKILTVAFSDGELNFAFVVDWPGNVNPWGKSLLKRMMETNRKWIAQNAAFELKWTWHLTNWHHQEFHDTEVLARLIHQRTGLGALDVLSRIYLGFDIKSLNPLDKERLKDYPIQKVLEYNAIDSWAEMLIFNKLSSILKPSLWDNYYRTLEAIKSTVGMELKGLAVNLEESKALDKDLLVRLKDIDKESHSIDAVEEYEEKEQKIFSISSPKVVAHVLTHYCDIKLPPTPSGEGYSTDSQDLEKLVDRHVLVKKTLDFRELQKLHSTYVKPFVTLDLQGVDGFIHPAYTVVHVATYRLSSKEPNIQNFPKRQHKEIRRQVIPRPGYIFAAFDYGQLEARTLVMASKDNELKRSFVEKEDIHSKWLNRLLEMYPAYLDRLRDKTGQTEEAKIRKAGRDIIKSDFVFACFYGSVAKSVADRAMLPMNIALDLLDEFWSAYRGVKSWIDGQFLEYERNASVQSLTGRVRNEILPGNEVINSPIQGTAAEIVLEAQNALFNQAVESDDINLMPRVNIHDDLIFELPESNEDKLEQYINYIGKEIVKPRFSFVNLPLMTECRIGYNWADLDPIAKFEGQEWTQ